MAARNKIDIEIGAEDKASGKVKDVIGTLDSLGSIISGFRDTVDMISNVGRAVVDLVRDAAGVESVKKAFEGLARSSGKSATEVLKALEKGSAGMVAQRDLMKTYNLAAQLVGTTFANQLPDAMGYLQKVSAATGQDMGFLLESLTRGVGRLSPMILDNLGIQVDLNEAYETYAKSIGKSVDELTKQEQQTALTNQVMEKLAENTANMPDVADSAAAKFAQFDAQMTNLKDTIGSALIPAFTDLLGTITNVFSTIVEKAPAVLDLFGMLGRFFAGGADWSAVMAKVRDVFGDEFADNLMKLKPLFEGIRDAIKLVVEKAGELIGKMKDWIDQHPETVKAVLLIGGAVVGLSLAFSAATTAINVVKLALDFLAKHPIILILGAIILLVGYLEEKFGSLSAALAYAGQVAQQLAFIIGFYLTVAWNWVRDNVVTPLTEAFNFLATVVWPAFRKAVEDAWDGVKTAIENVWNWLQTNVIVPITASVAWFSIVLWPSLRKAVEDAWNGIQEAISNVWNWIALNIFDPIKRWIDDFVMFTWPGLKAAVEDAWNKIQEAISNVWAWVLTNVFTPIDTWLTNAGIGWAAFKTNVTNAWNAVKAAVELVWNFLRDNIFMPIVVFFLQTIPNAVNSLKDAVTKAWNDLVAGVQEAWNTFKTNIIDPIINFFTVDIPNAIQTAIDKISEFLGIQENAQTSAAKWAESQLGGNTPGAIPGAPIQPPGQQLGTSNWGGGPVMIEPRAGPEVFWPQGAGQFMPNAGGMGGLTVNFNGSGGPANQAEADSMADMLLFALRERGLAVPR